MFSLHSVLQIVRFMVLFGVIDLLFFLHGILLQCCRAGVGKLRPSTNFCAARESLKQLIKKKLINLEERDWVHFFSLIEF